MTYWISTKSPVRMLDNRTDKITAAYLKNNQGIDAALLAADLGIARNIIPYYQLRLGLRKYAPCGRRKNLG
jgi:hypothetical protein